MANQEVQPQTQPGVAALLNEILSDIQDLLVKQLTVFHEELREDFSKTKKAVLPLVIGLVLTLVGGIILGASLSFLVVELANLPMWAGFGLVGLIVTAIAVTLIMVGKKRFDSFNPLPDKTVESVKENLQWLTKK